jgi:hypothetical protein
MRSVLASEKGRIVPAYIKAMERMPIRLKNQSANSPFVMLVLSRIYYLEEMG